MGIFAKELAGSFEKELSSAVSGMMKKTYNKVVEDYESKLDDFILSAKDRIDELYEYVPVKHIELNKSGEKIDVGGHVSLFWRAY